MNHNKEEVLVAERNFDSIFSYTAGEIRSKFLTELRDNKRVVGTRCDTCNMVWVPARSICVKCFKKLNEFVDVGSRGKIVTYSVVKTARPNYLFQPPFVLAIIQLDGADTSFVHFVNEIEPDKVATGMEVEAVFEDKRKGSILDIKYFKPR
jgi:uncharacterized OB-fold protein